MKNELIKPTRRQFLFGMLATAVAATVPIKMLSKEKKALENPKLTEVQAKKIEQNLRQAVQNPKQFIQDNCSHLKGRKIYTSKTYPHGREDYAISDHVFPNDSRRVCCLLCFKKWFPDKPGWDEALYMLKHTTNTNTASEVSVPGRPFKNNTVVF